MPHKIAFWNGDQHVVTSPWKDGFAKAVAYAEEHLKIHKATHAEVIDKASDKVLAIVYPRAN